MSSGGNIKLICYIEGMYFMEETNPNLKSNPLLITRGLPLFDQILPEHVVPAMQHVLAQAENEVAQLEATSQPTWDGLLKPMEQMDLPFEYAWGPIGHLLGVKNTEELRVVHETVLPELVTFYLRVQQSHKIYQGIKRLKASKEWKSLSEPQKRVVDLKLRDAEHAGVGLEGKSKERFIEVESELSMISTDFSNHVLDSNKAFEMIIVDKQDIEGWPESLMQLSAQSFNMVNSDNSKATPENGPWRITLDSPSFIPFMQHSRQRDQREKLYRAFVTRASDGDWDNSELIARTLKLRKEKAQLLGFHSYADLSLASKMAPDVVSVEEMSTELKATAKAHAIEDMEDLRQLAKEMGTTEPLAHWDIPFWSERLCEKRFDYTDEQLRPYFPLPRVLDGLFGLSGWLFGIAIEPADGEAPVWHPDVRYFKVFDDDGKRLASFYLDPYSRPHEKRGGAWMDDCLDRRWVNGELRLPVVHLCCNGTPPVGNNPSLMSFTEVVTLFHEFGHGLQCMLSTVDFASVAGINGVEWDAVELASQFMENWCYHKPTLMGITAHYETGDPLPEDLFEKIVAAQTFRAGSMMMRQLELGITDMELHSSFDPDGKESAFELHRRIVREMSVLPPLEDGRFLCAFSHIFAGGYAAGYYGYKWAEVLSADAFGAFEEVGLDNEPEIAKLGRRYRDTVLAQGGSRPPLEVFKEFRGRAPTTDALLRHRGLVG